MDHYTSAKNLYIRAGRTDFLGQGRFGEVWRCYSSDLRHARAVKLVRPCGSRDEINDTHQSIESEVKILKTMGNSPYIVNHFGVVNLGSQTGIVMEYMGAGNLTDFIKKRNAPLVLRLQMLYETAAGVSHLHSATFDKRISHNDLKPDNILLDDNLKVKICDFGGSDFTFRTSGSVRRVHSGSRVRTANYAAPEVLSGNYVRRTKAMDVFSYAMVTFFVLTGEHPFHQCLSSEVTNLYTANNRPALPEAGELPYDTDEVDNQKIYDTVVSNMKDCWKDNPDDRPEIREVKDKLKFYREKHSSCMEGIVKVLKRDLSVSDEKTKKECTTSGDKYITLEQKFCYWDDRNVHSAGNVVLRKATVDPEISTSSQTTELTDENFTGVLKPGDKIRINTPGGAYQCHVERTVTKGDNTILDEKDHIDYFTQNT